MSKIDLIFDYCDKMIFKLLIKEGLMRVSFDSVFRINPNGSFSPIQQTRIRGVIMGPGVSFSRGVIFSGVEIAQYVGHDLDIENEAGGIVNIKGIF